MEGWASPLCTRYYLSFSSTYISDRFISKGLNLTFHRFQTLNDRFADVLSTWIRTTKGRMGGRPFTTTTSPPFEAPSTIVRLIISYFLISRRLLILYKNTEKLKIGMYLISVRKKCIDRRKWLQMPTSTTLPPPPSFDDSSLLSSQQLPISSTPPPTEFNDKEELYSTKPPKVSHENIDHCMI